MDRVITKFRFIAVESIVRKGWHKWDKWLIGLFRTNPNLTNKVCNKEKNELIHTTNTGSGKNSNFECPGERPSP